jgi:hypothetical protein
MCVERVRAAHSAGTAGCRGELAAYLGSCCLGVIAIQSARSPIGPVDKLATKTLAASWPLLWHASGRAVDLRTTRRQPHQDRNRPKGVAGVAACVDT